MKIYILTILSLFLFFSHSVQSQTIFEGPTTVRELCDATYKLHYHFVHDVTYSWMFPWPTPLTVKNVYEREPNNYKVQIRTLVFLHSGQDTITAGGIDKGITIISNPFSIILPDHICPQGTQITTSEVSSFFFQKFFRVWSRSYC